MYIILLSQFIRNLFGQYIKFTIHFTLNIPKSLFMNPSVTIDKINLHKPTYTE
jgi:hypothetical protein